MHRSGVSGRLAIAQSYEEGVPKGHGREGLAFCIQQGPWHFITLPHLLKGELA